MRVANGEVDGEERDGIEDAEVIEDADKIGDEGR